MWIASSISWRPFSLSAIPISTFNLPPTVTLRPNHRHRRLSAQPQNDAASSAGDPTISKSKLNQITQVPDSGSNEVGDGRQLSGSDVLWALQRAAAQKEKRVSRGKKKKKKMGSSPVGGNRGGYEEDALDYSRVRDLVIKNEWGPRLEELERRLQELSDT